MEKKILKRVIYLKSGSDNIISICRDKISNSGDTYPRYIEYVESIIINKYDSIDTMIFKDINSLITITVNSEIQYKVEYKGDPNDFLKSIIREEKLKDLLK